MMEKLNLCQKLIEIRKCIPYLKKDTKGYNYTYVSGSSILSQIQDKMNELGILLVPSVTGKNLHIDHYESTNSKGVTSTKEVRIVEAHMIMAWVDAESGDRMEVPWLLFGEQDEASKAFGSGLTYSERYFLLKFFNVPTDDDDPDSRQKPPKEPLKKPPIKTAADAGVAVQKKLKADLSKAMGDMTDSGKKKFFAWLKEKYEGEGVEQLQLMLKDIEVLKEEWVTPVGIPDDVPLFDDNIEM